MDILTQRDLQQLIETSGECCVSLYMPTHRVGREQQQDPIRFKNLVVRAQERLLGYGLRRPEVQGLMRPAENLVEDGDFWQHQDDGLAVFLSSNFSQTYRLPSRFKELLAIANNFHIKPLLPLFSTNGQFYILAVSLNKIRLFLATRDTVSEMQLSNVPTSMQEALFMDIPEKHLDYHTGTKNPGPHGDRPAAFHGQGMHSDEEEKKNILRDFHYVDKGLKNELDSMSIPMVLAGVDYLLPIYHEANTYNSLLDEGLEGNPEGLSAKELHQRAWELVEPIFRASQQEAMRQFERLHGKQSGLASDDLKTVVKAAKYGRVDTLFVPLGVQQWGRFEADKNQVLLEEEPSLENEDLLDFAATQTILNSGRVYALRPEELPGKGELAAILRYPR
jgi:hypothetical protein